MTLLGAPAGRCQTCGGQLYATPGGRILCAGRCDDIAPAPPPAAPLRTLTDAEARSLVDALILAERAVHELDHDGRGRVGAWSIDEAVATRDAARARLIAALTGGAS